MPPVAESVDPRAIRTRRAIEKAYESLIGEYRPREITIGMITDRAGVNRTTFYAHYEGREALTASKLRTELVSRIDRALPPRPRFNRENLARFIVATLGFLETSRHDRTDPVQIEAFDKAIFDYLRSWRKACPSEWLPQVGPEVAATVLSCSIAGVGERWLKATNRRPATEVAGDILALLAP